MKFLVYGTLKQAFGNHRILFEGRAQFLGKAVTLDPFVMAGYGVPFVWPHPKGHPMVGELYDIGDNAQTLARLDRLESNGHVYERKQHTVRVIEGPDGIKPLPRDSGDLHDGVWIYEGMSNFGGAPKPTDPDVLRWLDLDEGRFEWEPVRSRRPLNWTRVVGLDENIGSTTTDHRARPLGEVLRADENIGSMNEDE